MRPLIFVSVFTAGLVAGIVGSAFASSAGTVDISATESGAWVITNEGAVNRLEFCRTETEPRSTTRIIICTERVMTQ